MFTEEDRLLVRETRKELTAGRTKPITIEYKGAGTVDDITGEIIGGQPGRLDVMAVVTEITSAAGTGIERILINGVEVEKGDIILSVDYDLVADIVAKIERVVYDGKQYAVMALDKKGLGGYNRIEVLGRVIT